MASTGLQFYRLITNNQEVMKIISTAILLLFTLLAVPAISYFFGTAPGPAEWEAVATLAKLAAAAVVLTFVTGELTGNNSQVDKLWSILPVVYTWFVADYGNYAPRLVLMSILVTIWGVRLTVNFGLKGAYLLRFWAGEEDYRWKVLRRKPEFSQRWKWTLFNLFFISGYQNVLILLFTLPTILALQYPDRPLGTADFLIAGLMLFFIGYETVADIQQWNFQSRKKSCQEAGGVLPADVRKGFLDRGLWAFSRHPNYFAEQSIWICFYLFSIAAGGAIINWSITGCLLLVVLFQGSSNFSESISAGKYPEYRAYQQKVSRFIPLPNNRKK